VRLYLFKEQRTLSLQDFERRVINPVIEVARAVANKSDFALSEDKMLVLWACHKISRCTVQLVDPATW